MKNRIILILLFLAVSYNYGQNNSYYDIVDDIEYGQQATSVYTSKINLSGNYNMMVIVIGFPDVPSTRNWPQMYPASEYYPYQGSLPDGTTLNNYLLQNDPINIEDWHGEGFEQFFDIQSNGEFTVNVEWPKTITGIRYLTDSTLTYWETILHRDFNVIFSKWNEMANQVAKKMVFNNPSIFDDIDLVQISFDGVAKRTFHTEYGGFTSATGTITLRDPNDYNNIYWTGPYAVNRQTSSLVHEFCHRIGSIAGRPSGFSGLPDRGEDIYVDDDHYNLITGYDIMYHNDHFPSLNSLYGLVPLNSHDLIFFDWIKDDEIKVINEGESLSGIKLADMTLPLTETQKSDNFYRIIKVMINENYLGDQDEYFLLEYHKGTNFDRQYHNHDELPYNEGVLVWHIKERDNFGIFSDAYIDLELAVPYNGWNGNPIPDNGYVGTYNYDRSSEGTYNGNHALDFDWLDDIQTTNGVFDYMPDGGTNIWSYTVPNDITNHFTWDISGERWLERINSLKSDFFTDQPINGIVTNKMTHYTRPSTKDWEGNASQIGIKNIRKVNNYMMVDVFANYWEGEITENTTIAGNVRIGSNLTVASGVTLTVDEGTDITFENGSALIVNGTLNISGTTTNKVTFDFIAQNSTLKNGIKINTGGVANISNAIIKNAYNGVYVNEAVANLNNCEIFDCTYGVHLYRTNYVTNSKSFITDSHFYDNADGLFLNYSTAQISNNEFSLNSFSGINCSNYSSPDLAPNDLNSNSTGYNYIHNNYHGIYAYNSSSPFLGRESCEDFGGNNSFESNNVQIKAASYCSIYAENNWWGTSSPTSSLFALISSFVDYTPYLLQSPIVEQSTIKITPEEEEFNKKFVPQVTSSANATEPLSLVTSTNEKSNYNDKWSIEWKLLYARNLMRVKKYNQAADICESVITDYPDSARSYLALDLLWQSRKKDNKTLFKEYVSNKSKSKVKKQIYGAAELMLAVGEKDNKIKLFEEIEAKYSKTALIEHVLFSKFMYYLFEENNIELAKTTADELGKLYPESESYYASQRHLGSDAVKPTEQLLAKEAVNEATKEIPQTYELLGNYPNPFNPSTTIKYALPYSSDVELTIYDITGKVITTLNRNGQSAGYQNIVWNGNSQQGSRVSSGIYFYRFKASSIDGSNKVFEKTAKMLLLK